MQQPTLEMIERPPYPIRAALYFVEGGHYLFRTFGAAVEPRRGKKVARAEGVKFVRSSDVAAAFSGQDLDSGWLPAGVVRMGYSARGAWFVYGAPGQKVAVTLGERQARIPIPRTVLVGVGQTYYLFAQRGQHLEPHKDLCHAPFPNVYPDGRICWGQNNPPEAGPEKARGVWQLFFDAPFNGDLAGQKCRSHAGSVLDLLGALDGASKFPEGELITHTNSLEWTIKHLIGGER